MGHAHKLWKHEFTGEARGGCKSLPSCLMLRRFLPSDFLQIQVVC